MKLGRWAALIMGWSLVYIRVQVGLGFRQADACLILVWIFLALCAHGVGGAGVSRPDHVVRGC